MLDAKTVPGTSIPLSLQDRLATWLVLAYQVLVLIAFAIIPLKAYAWLRVPFMGVLVEHTLLTNSVGPARPGSWSAYAEGLDDFGNRVLSVGGEPVRSSADIQRVLGEHRVGETIPLTVLTPQGEQHTLEVRLQKFPLRDRAALLFIPYLIGLVYLGCGLWVLSLRRHDAAGRAFALFAASVAVALGALFDLYTTHSLTYLWTFALAMAGGGLFIMAMVFPQEIRWLRKYPLLRWLPVVLAGLLVLFSFPTLFNLRHPQAYVAAWSREYAFTALSILAFLGMSAARLFTSRSPIVREQARVILLGSLVAFAPTAVWMILTTLKAGVPFRPSLLISLIAFPIATAYAILRYRLLNTDYLLSRAVLYALLTVLGTASYGLLVWGSTLLFGRGVAADHPLLIGLGVGLFAVVFNPLRLWLQRRIDASFFRGQAVYQQISQEFGRQLTQTVELFQILKLLRENLEHTLHPSLLHIFIHDPLSDQYLATPDERGRPTTDVRFSIHSAVVGSLTREQPSLFLADIEQLPERFLPDRARLALSGAQLFVAIPGQEALSGMIALGAKRSGEPYSRRDLAFVEGLGDQAALAIQRAQTVANLERRVHEMNVLTRVGQGLNVTMRFDDMLELIYAQTVQVIPTRHLTITLYDKSSHTFTHVFYLKDDERLRSEENLPLPHGYGLEQEVILQQRALVTDDYERACRQHSVRPGDEGFYAWMGVPLNTGDETIGAISLGSTDPAVYYTREQQNLLQAIADLAAGAIVKSRLLHESEERARQLETLNQVARSLTSTLELEPLLHQILESAVEILHCEAGTLFLVDPETDELVFEVTVGPVADTLVGLRLAPGTGLVGKAVDTRRAIIVNNVQESEDWFGGTDRETGFRTHAMLVVPMQVRDQVVGVVEILNKKDGSPFSHADESLLTAFTTQAAIAIQNARLFTMTDQALAARVEELSVMQRIDRQLNASLDVQRALHITLDWAVRHSKATAGLACLVEREESGEIALTAITTQGYEDAVAQAGSSDVLALPAVQAALHSGQPQHLHADGESISTLLPEARSLLVLPIHRQQELLSLILLESPSPQAFDEETLAFLFRLSDHAAIAISNAQLYGEVQAANQAKSDFISFVSHELKTPMTSIKGYTDLLLAGAVGAVNENQSGFLRTIRANVERMARLVSDLADISRIEAGRLRLDFGAVSVREVVEEVVHSTQGQIDQKRQQLVLEVADTLPEVWADRTRMVQVLANLVSNAHKYTPEGGRITIRAEATSNRWQPHGAPKVVLLSVEDTGIGIKPEEQKLIFTKFFRSEDEQARQAPGTGLGLNITRNLVEMQGGRIWFESEYGQGTRFYFTIPVVQV